MYYTQLPTAHIRLVATFTSNAKNIGIPPSDTEIVINKTTTDNLKTTAERWSTLKVVVGNRA